MLSASVKIKVGTHNYEERAHIYFIDSCNVVFIPGIEVGTYTEVGRNTYRGFV